MNQLLSSRVQLTFCLVDLPISACGNCSTAGVTHCVKDGGLMMSSTTVSLASLLFCGVSRMVPFSVKSRDRPGLEVYQFISFLLVPNM